MISCKAHAFGSCAIVLNLTFFLFGVYSLTMEAASGRNYLNPFLKRYPSTSSSGMNSRLAPFFVIITCFMCVYVIFDKQCTVSCLC